MRHVHVASRITRGANGRRGARLVVRFEQEHGRDSGFLPIDTHGLSDEAIEDAIAKAEGDHRAKSARLDDFDRLRARDVRIRGDVYRVVDCTILPCGATAHELYVDVRRVVAGEVDDTPLAAELFPLRVVCGSLSQIPRDDEISAEVVKRLLRAREDDDGTNAEASRLARFGR